MLAAGSEVRAVLGSADGIALGVGAVTAAVARWTFVGRGATSVGVADCGPLVGDGASTAACVATSGREVDRGVRLGTGEGVWAIVGWLSEGA